MVSKGGQVSTEFIILFALLIVFLVPMAYLILQATLDSTEQVSYARINSIFAEVAAEAREVYFRGPHSRIVVSANIPSNIREVQILKAESLTGGNDKYFFRIVYYAERQEQIGIIPLEVPINIEELSLPSINTIVDCNADYSCSIFRLDEFQNEGLRHIQISNSYDSSSTLKVKFELVRVP